MHDAEQSGRAGQGTGAQLVRPVLRWQVVDIMRHCATSRVACTRRRRVQMQETRNLARSWEERRLVVVSEQTAKVLFHPPQKDGARRCTAEVPAATLIELQLADGLDHGRDSCIFFLLSLLLLLAAVLDGLGPLALTRLELVLDCWVQSGIAEVHVWDELAEQSLGSRQFVLQSLNILRRRIASPVGGLVVCTFCRGSSLVSPPIRSPEKDKERCAKERECSDEGDEDSLRRPTITIH